MNRDYDTPIFIDFPHTSPSNVSLRRAAFFSTLPNRMDMGFMTRTEAYELQGPFPTRRIECAFTRRLALRKRNFRITCIVAAVAVGILVNLVSMAICR